MGFFWAIAVQGVTLGACAVAVAQDATPVERVIEARDPKHVVGAIVDKSEPDAPPAEIRTADDLLLALEFADRGLRTLRADVLLDKVGGAMGDRQARRGTLWFDAPGGAGGGNAAARKFAVQFRTMRVDARERDDDQHYIFDGEWLVERTASQKQFIKRQVTPPGKAIDPLRIGEGPFPIPIGQKRSDTLTFYTAELLPAAEGVTPQESDSAKQMEDERRALEKFVTVVTTGVRDPKTGVVTQQETPAKFYQLKLVLRPEYKDEPYQREVRLWYREVGASEGGGRMLLPRMARAVNRAGDVTLAQLTNVKVNQPIEAGVMDTTPPTDPAWDVRVEPYVEEPAPAAERAPVPQQPGK